MISEIRAACPFLSTIFYVSAALLFLSASLMLLLSLDFKLPTQSLTKDIFGYLRKAEVVMFYSAMLAAGESTGLYFVSVDVIIISVVVFNVSVLPDISRPR